METPDRAERFSAIAKHFAALDSAARAKTLVIEPSREGRDALTADIRAELAKAGALTGPAVTMQSLVSKCLSRADARVPAHVMHGQHRPGMIDDRRSQQRSVADNHRRIGIAAAHHPAIS